MPADSVLIAQPALILVAWGAGLGFVGGAMAFRKLVGPGFSWLTAGVAVVISIAGALSEGAWWARAAIAVLALGVVWARNRSVSAAFQLVGAALLLIEASIVGGPLPAASATLALGGVTGEMLLGHWYLIDPRLPRSALRFLAAVGIGGLGLDSVVLAGAGLPSGGATVAYWVLAATSVVLMAAVLGALRYPAYAGVMAATGLSYLAVLTTLAGVFLGRVLVAGLGPFGI